MYIYIFLHNIHYKDLYGTSSRLVLRGASNASTAIKNSFKAVVECTGMDLEEQ